MNRDSIIALWFLLIVFAIVAGNYITWRRLDKIDIAVGVKAPANK